LPAYYAGLTPDAVLAAVEMLGLRPDGRLLSLNSYENRVYRIGLEEPHAGAMQVVAKFYRERRWSDAQIREEHAFIAELAAAELPVASPLVFGGQTLHLASGYRYTLFECRPGASPDLDQPGHRALLGRTLGRLHAVGGRQRFRQRIGIGQWRHGGEARERLLELGAVPAPLDEQYAAVAGQLVDAVAACFEAVGPVRHLRLHGDCHPGNILWQQTGPLFVDFDDSLNGPAVQDLWMFASGEPAQMRREWTELLDGYEQFASFDAGEARLIEALRAMRMLNHAAWIAQRWSDPAFPRAFPWFGEPRHWERHLHELREQLEAVEDPPLLRG
jgi:Ser/Thr protein kinase RdoA (MazF antagonist)